LYKKLLFIVAIILFSTTAYALTLSLQKTIYSQEDLFQGTILIEPGNYPLDSKVKLKTGTKKKEIRLQSLVNCNDINCALKLPLYSTSGATESSLNGTSILTGIRIKEGSVIEDVFFDISNKDANLPNSPIIDIGNDGIIDWEHQGTSTDNYQDIYLPPINSFEETLITDNCQKFTLPKALKFKVEAYVKKSSPSASTLDIYMPGVSPDKQIGQCTQPTNSWGKVDCRISVNTKPLTPGDYFFCLTGSDNILATNLTTENPQGHIKCSSNCIPVEKDYVMNFSAADFVTTLSSTVNVNTSNTVKDAFGFFSPLTDIVNDYLDTCQYENGDCIVPINVSSKDNPLTVSNLSYKETTTLEDILIRRNFLSFVEKRGEVFNIAITTPTLISLASFNFRTLTDLGNQSLEVSFKSKTDSKTHTVVKGPKAQINVSKLTADVNEPIVFDASKSTSSTNTSLIYKWDFDDNSTSNLIKPTHSFSTKGIYVIELKVTDANNITSTRLQTISIGVITPTITNFDMAIESLDQAQSFFAAASPDIKEISQILDYERKIITSKSNLIRNPYQVDSILDSSPRSLAIENSFAIMPFPTTEELSVILPLQDNSFKETVRNVNEKIEQEIKLDLVTINFISGRSEKFVLVRKTIDVPQKLDRATVIDLIPNPLAANIEFIQPPQAEITSKGQFKQIKFDQDLKVSQSNDIVYRLLTSTLTGANEVKTLVLPENLRVGLVEISCGDNVCNPGEDIVSCPEDCSCGNDICELDETTSSCPQDCKPPLNLLNIVIIIISVLIIIAIPTYILIKNPKYITKIKNLFNKVLNKKSLFASDDELKKVIKFIKASKKEGHIEKQINISLIKKGWTQDQVNHAMKKSK
jgi:competence protein ComGC